MRLKKERVKRVKKLGNLTVIADKVNIVSPSGKVGGLKMGAGVQAPKRQYQFSYNVDQGAAPSVTSPSDSVPPPTGPPTEPANPVGNALGRIGTMLGQAAWSYAAQPLLHRAGQDTFNWMFNSQTDPNVAQITELSPTDPTAGSPASIYTLANSELAQHEEAISRGQAIPPPINTNLTGSPTDVFYTPAAPTAGTSPTDSFYTPTGTSPTDSFYTPQSGTPTDSFYTPQSGTPTDQFYSATSGSLTAYSPASSGSWTPPYAQYQPQPGVWPGNMSPNQQVPPFLSPTTSGSSGGSPVGPQPGVWPGNMSPNQQVPPFLSPTTSGGSSSPESGVGLGMRYGRLGFMINPIDTTGMEPRSGMNLLQRLLPSSPAGRFPPTTNNIGTQTANDSGISVQTSTGSPSRQSVGTGTDQVRSRNMGSSPISSQVNTVGTSMEPVGRASKKTGTETVSMTTSGTSPIAEKIMNDVGIDVSPTLTAALGEQFAEPVRAEMRQLVDEHASFVSRTRGDVERLMEIHEALAELYQQSQAELSTQTGYTTAMAQYVAEFADIVLGHQNWRSAINQELPISDQVGTILNGLIAVDPGLRNYFKRLFNFTDRLYEISHSDMQTVNAQMMSTGTSPIGRSTMDSSTSPLGPQPGIWPGHMDRGTDPASPLSRVLNSPTISLPPSPMIPRARSRPGAISTAGMSARSGLMSAYRNVRGRGEIVNRYTGDDWIPQTRTRRRVREYDQPEERPARRGRR